MPLRYVLLCSPRWPFSFLCWPHCSHSSFSLQNEYLMSSTLEPHPNINRYFCHFTDRIPQEYYNHLPEVAKELAFDPMYKRMHACIWVVLEHHSETLEQFLRHLSTQHPQAATTTPWPIVHKYSRDICAALVHLFVNRTIHFDVKLDNIVVSSNKEQAILIDLGCAKKFPRASDSNKEFEIKTKTLTSVSGNLCHRAPEIVNGLARYTQNPDKSSMSCCEKQPSFELGCILFEFSMCGRHPLPGYPTPSRFSFESEEQFPMKPPAFPKEFCNLVRSLLQFDPGKRMSLLEASEVLANIDPCPDDLLPFYNCIVCPLNDAGTLTAKATCEILCGAAKDCVDTIHKALELESSFSPALLLLHYLTSCSDVALCPTDCNHQQEIHGALTGKTATFTAADVEFTRAIINKKHRTTLPELVLTALWTRHISHEPYLYSTVTQLLLKKVQTAAIQQPEILVSRLLRDVIRTRNEMMLEALSQLHLGNIDSALGFVAAATCLFDGYEMPYINRTHSRQYMYLPGLLFLYCLCCASNDHVTLHQRIPTSLSLYFSRALSCSAEVMKLHCEGVLSTLFSINTKGCVAEPNLVDVTGEWQELVVICSAHKAASQSGTEWPWAHKYFVALWRTFCRKNYQSASASESAVAIWEELSTKAVSATSDHPQIKASSNSHLGFCYEFGLGVDKDIHKAMSMYQKAANAGDAKATLHLSACHEHFTDIHKAVEQHMRAADAGNAVAMYNLAVCYENGQGVGKNTTEAVRLYQNSASAGNTSAMCNLGVCYENGDGVARDVPKAVSLYQMAADAGDSTAMCNLGHCFYSGNGVAKEIPKAVSLFQRAAVAGDARAMYNLAVCYGNGQGADRDIRKALVLYQGAADRGHAMAMYNLAVCYADGAGVDRDPHKAVELFRRAADAGEAKAMFSLAVCYEAGRVVPQDMGKAVALYSASAELGHKGAIDRLSDLRDLQSGEQGRKTTRSGKKP
ncbi:sel1 repeat family protein [Pelomyxa schiedti]|nr:sel1 repeat family protein [Pelomyxa schiedti]